MAASPGEVTQLLAQVKGGDQDALARLIPILYKELRRLSALNPRQTQVVEMRYFAGLTIEETAEALGVPSITVKRDWAIAKAWLHRELSGRGAS